MSCEGIYFQARVLCNQKARCMAGIVESLFNRVCFEGSARFSGGLDSREPGQWLNRNAAAVERKPKFTELAGIRSRAMENAACLDQAHFRRHRYNWIFEKK